MERDLPEGVADALVPGGWESADAVDTETSERNDAARGSDEAVGSDDPVESDEITQGADPDLAVEDDEPAAKRGT